MREILEWLYLRRAALLIRTLTLTSPDDGGTYSGSNSRSHFSKWGKASLGLLTWREGEGVVKSGNK